MSDYLVITHELELIKNTVQLCPNGITIDEIMRHLNVSLSRRTVQRRLVYMQKEKIVYSKGNTRSKKYFITTATQEQKEASTQFFESIPLSSEGHTLRNTLRVAVEKRIPVTYNRDFLDQYTPNISYYLSNEQREKLAELGKINVPEQVQVAGTYNKEILSRLFIDLSWNSSRLEGNTYSLLDTQRLIEFGESVDTKSAKDAQMILNHKDAIEFLVQSPDEIGFNPEWVEFPAACGVN